MFVQKRPSYRENATSEMSGGENALIYGGDVSGSFQTCLMCLDNGMLVLPAGLFALCSGYVVICVSVLDMQCMSAVFTQCKVGSFAAKGPDRVKFRLKFADCKAENLLQQPQPV